MVGSEIGNLPTEDNQLQPPDTVGMQTTDVDMSDLVKIGNIAEAESEQVKNGQGNGVKAARQDARGDEKENLEVFSYDQGD